MNRHCDSPRPSFSSRLVALAVVALLASALALGQANSSYTVDTVAGQDPLGHPQQIAQAALETVLHHPAAIAVSPGPGGFLYFSDFDTRRVRFLSQSSVRTRRADVVAHSLALGPGGTLYTGLTGRVSVLALEGEWSIEAPGSSEEPELGFGEISGIAVAPDGTVYFSDRSQHVVRRYDPDGSIEIVAGTLNSPGTAGDGGAATAAQLDTPERVALDDSGNLYIADSGNFRIRRVDGGGSISTVAGNGTEGQPEEGEPALASPLGRVSGIDVDAFDNLYISDPTFHVVLRVAAGGILERVVGTGERGFDGDGNPATLAQLDSPQDIAARSDGVLLVADTGNSRIRKVALDGTISTEIGRPRFGGDGGLAVEAFMNRPSSLVSRADGSLVVADTENHRLRVISADGIISTLAGSGKPGFNGDTPSALDAQLESPNHTALDSNGDAYFADSSGLRVRRVAGGSIETLAGSSEKGEPQDGGLAAEQSFGRIQGLAVDEQGRVYISDCEFNRIVRFAPGGVIEAVAGTGGAGFSGDGSSADILYAGVTRWAGVYLVRIRLPSDLSAGKRIIRVTVNGFQSPEGYVEVAE